MTLAHNHPGNCVDSLVGSVGASVSPEPKVHPCTPHRHARIKATKFNWDVVRRRYVTGVSEAADSPPGARELPSLAEVAREFGASLGRVEAVSARDRWPDQREAFRQRLRIEEDRLVLKRLASLHVRARYNAFMLAGQILDLVVERLKLGEIPPKELVSLARAAQWSQEISEIAINGHPVKLAKTVENYSNDQSDWTLGPIEPKPIQAVAGR